MCLPVAIIAIAEVLPFNKTIETDRISGKTIKEWRSGGPLGGWHQSHVLRLESFEISVSRNFYQDANVSDTLRLVCGPCFGQSDPKYLRASLVRNGVVRRSEAIGWVEASYLLAFVFLLPLLSFLPDKSWWESADSISKWRSRTPFLCIPLIALIFLLSKFPP
jgi:hypothetical protein